MIGKERETEEKATKTSSKKRTGLFIAAGSVLVVAIGAVIFFNSPQYKYRTAVSGMLQAAEEKDYENVRMQFEEAYGIDSDSALIAKLMTLYDAQLIELMQGNVYDDDTEAEMTAIFQSRDAVLSDAGETDAVLDSLNEDSGYTWITDKKKTEKYFVIGWADKNYADHQYEAALAQYDEILTYAESAKAADYAADLKSRATDGVIQCELMLAGQLTGEQNYDAALEKYDHVRQLDPKREEAYMGASNVYLHQEDVLAAIDVLKTGSTQCTGSSLTDRRQYIIDNSVVATKAEYQSRNGEKDAFPTYIWEYNTEGQVTTEKRIDSDNGDLIASTVYTYDSNGNVIREDYPGRDEEERTDWKEYHYDDKNRLTEEIMGHTGFDGKRTNDVQTVYSYYDDGTLHEEHHYRGDGTDMQETEYLIYDSLGRIIKNSGGINVDGRVQGGFNAGLVFTEYEYAENGRIAKISTNDASGVCYTEVYTYYDTGIRSSIVIDDFEDNKHEEKRYNEAGFLLDDSGRFEYNEAGEIVARYGWHYNNDTTTFSYDENHRLVNIYYTTDFDAWHSMYNYCEEGFVRMNGPTRNRKKDTTFSYDSMNLLIGMQDSTTTETCTYVDTGSASYDDGTIYLLTNGHSWYKPTFSTTTEEKTYTYKYVSCDEDDPDRILSASDQVEDYLEDFMDYEPYYTVSGSYKQVRSAPEAEYQYNEFGDVSAETTSYRALYYDYTYRFVGEIE